MDSMSIAVQQAQMFLIYTSVFMMFILTGFLVYFLVNATGLVKSLNELSILVKHELEPTIKELNKALENVNSVAENADKHVESLKSALEGLLTPASAVIGKAKGLSSALVTGVIAGLKLFSKKK